MAYIRVHIYHKKLREEMPFCQKPGCNPDMAGAKDLRIARKFQQQILTSNGKRLHPQSNPLPGDNS